ncbi:hypothetical protein PG996_013219 [Apiospora saccharicola]|uniref:F-box domain-containing protein n=1 Tax=Apiospora saccharicola TaxID=335842 RepID=A0ABR1U4Z5_9PEZI
MLLCERVVAPTELLEAVLLGMDMRTLLTVAQRVCRRWHHLICTSPSLQKALFFEPENAVLSTNPLRNPLLAEIFTVWFDYDASTERGFGRRGEHYFKDFRASPFAKNLDVVLHKNATWRQMLVQQPPLVYLGDWTHTYSEMGHHEEFLMNGPYPHGLRMESLYDWTLWERMHSEEHTRMRMLWDFKRHLSLPESKVTGITGGQTDQLQGWKWTPDVVMESSLSITCTPEDGIEGIMRQAEFDLDRERGKKNMAFAVEELEKLLEEEGIAH